MSLRLQALCRVLYCAAVVFAVFAPPAARAVTVGRGEGIYNGEESFAFDAALVDDRWAVAWVDGWTPERAGTVRYARALDAEGTEWGPTVTVELNPAWEGTSLQLQFVNGKPAVCYYKQHLEKLAYIRATDAAGSAWGEPLLLDLGGDFARPVDMEIVGGNPAIAYAGILNGKYFAGYVRATDADGSTWGTRVQVADASAFGKWCSMTVLADGHPALAYIQNGVPWYVRAADAEGAAWNAPVKVGPDTSTYGCVLRTPAGSPAMCYITDDSFLRFTKATDPAGSGWNADPALEREYLWTLSLGAVNGTTLAAWTSVTGTKVAENRGTPWVWKTSLVMGAGFGQYNHRIIEAAGRPALIWTSGRTIEFTRAVSTGGAQGTRWLPFPLLEQPPGSVLSFGAARDLGVKRADETIDFVLRNSGNACVDLVVSSLTLEGPDAAEFFISSPMTSSVLPAGGSATFSMKFAPVTPGKKSAVLRVASNAESPYNDYTLPLSAVSIPDIAVERPAGTQLSDGTALSFPITAPGSPALINFTVKNPGSADLNSLAITIDGPDSGEFSVTAELPSSIPSGGSAAVIVRHAPLTSDTKSASLHIASNVEGTRNPFDIPLRVVEMAPGSVDPYFHAVPKNQVNAMAVRPNGTVLAAGILSLESFNSDGTPDLSFLPPAISRNSPTYVFVDCLAVQKDGRILIGGDFDRINGQPRKGLARLHSDGSLDDTFAPNLPGDKVWCLAIQPDGQILAGGGTYLGTSRPFLVRLSAAGLPDTGFNPVAERDVHRLALQPDGKILTGEISNFGTVRLLRFSANGTLDSFLANASSSVSSLAVQTNGEILIGDEGGIRRIFPDGVPDPSMSLYGTGAIFDLALQADGKCVVEGAFGSLGGLPRRYLARLSEDGSVDSGFGVNATNYAISLALQADGKVLVGGGGAFVRLLNDPAFSLLKAEVLKAEGGSTMRWMRSGTAPEVRDVTFDVMPDGSPDWTPLGVAARIPGGWELSGLTLPAYGQIRAQAYAGGSLIEETAPVLTPLESWRLQYFNSSSNTGDAADDADPDLDGLTNFAEFAFGLSPVDRGSSALPEFIHTGGTFAASFFAPPGTEDVIYSAQWSATLRPGQWAAIPDSGTGGGHVFSITGGAKKRFVRFVVRMR